jgi:hypothetical protein
MNFETRISLIIQLFFLKFQEKILFFHNFFSIALFALFSGFLIANLFGSFLNFLRNFIIWDGFIILFLIMFIELINSIIYKNKARKSIFFYFTNFFLAPDNKQFQTIYSSTSQQNKLQNVHFEKNNFKQVNNLTFWKTLNYFKLGFMLGFFIDAFKVGS